MWLETGLSYLRKIDTFARKDVDGELPFIKLPFGDRIEQICKELQ